MTPADPSQLPYVRASLLSNLIPHALEDWLPLTTSAHCSLPAYHCQTRGAPNTVQEMWKDRSEKEGTSARHAQPQGWKGKGPTPKRAQ